MTLSEIDKTTNAIKLLKYANIPCRIRIKKKKDLPSPTSLFFFD